MHCSMKNIISVSLARPPAYSGPHFDISHGKLSRDASPLIPPPEKFNNKLKIWYRFSVVTKIVVGRFSFLFF